VVDCFQDIIATVNHTRSSPFTHGFLANGLKTPGAGFIGLCDELEFHEAVFLFLISAGFRVSATGREGDVCW
jgi:hypothetical protein